MKLINILELNNVYYIFNDPLKCKMISSWGNCPTLFPLHCGVHGINCLLHFGVRGGGQFPLIFWSSGDTFPPTLLSSQDQLPLTFWSSVGKFPLRFWSSGDTFPPTLWSSQDQLPLTFRSSVGQFPLRFWSSGGTFPLTFWPSICSMMFSNNKVTFLFITSR